MTALNEQQDGHGPLAALVHQLRAERDGLRQAMHTRAVIEQAKGILIARHQITADEAFDRLRTVSQRSNTRLAAVAARVVAQASPPPVDSGGDSGLRAPQSRDSSAPDAATSEHPVRDAHVPHGKARRGHRVRASTAGDGVTLHTQHLLTRARLDSAGNYDDVVTAVLEASLGWPRPHSVVLALAEPDAALRVVASRGLAPETASQWTRIPPQVDVPLTTAARTGSPVWFPESQQLRQAYPLVATLGADAGACATMPLAYEDRIVGALGITWSVAVELDGRRRSYLMAMAEATSRVTARLLAAESPEAVVPRAAPGAAAPTWILPLLDGSLTAAALLAPRRIDGVVADFVFEEVNAIAASAGARGALRLAGTSLLTAMPEVGARTLMPLYRDVLADGRPRQIDELHVPGPSPDDPGEHYTVRAVRLGDRVFATWRLRSPAERIYDDMVAAGRTAGVAAFRWHLPTGELRCSPNLRALLDWPAGSAITAGTVRKAIEPRYWPAVRAAVVAAVRDGVPLSATVATRRGRRWLRLTGERLTDAGGRPLALRGCVQDISELRAGESREHRLSEARAADRRRANGR